MTRDDPAFAPPPAFGPFRVLHQIGIGALGPVFRTYEPTRDRLVAVKLFRLDITPEQAQALADELARACDAGLFHPSLVEPIAAGVQGTAAYRAEEYVAGESLDVAIRHYAPASLEKVLPFVTQLAAAIDFARTGGVGHGALHLRDVFVTPDEARASGFGVVESLERVGLRAPVRRPYSAPERIAGAAWGTPADVFSLAAITYELLTARRPSGTGAQIGALSGEHLGGNVAAIHAVLARAMDEDPGRRYATAIAFTSALEAAGRGGTDVVTSAGAAISGDWSDLSADASASLPSASMRAGRSSGSDVGPPHVELIETEPDPQFASEPELESIVDAPRPVEVAAVPEEEEEEDDDDEEEDLVGAAAVSGPTILEDAPATIADAPVAAEPPRMWLYEPTPEETPVMRPYGFIEPDRSRSPVLGVTLGVLIGMLIGLAGGYALASRWRTETVQQASTSPPAPQVAPDTSATPSQPQRSGRAWSEQAVAQPTAPPRVPATAPPPRPTRGSITVESTPKNAAVTVNGRWRGRTPVTVEDLAFGTHTVRIVQPGFSVARQAVTLSTAQPARTVVFQLERPAKAAAPPSSVRAPATHGAQSGSGSLFVASNPPGARVFVDGKPVGTAPVRVPEVPSGAHVIRLELPDHRIWSTSERVAPGQETRVAGSLERIQ